MAKNKLEGIPVLKAHIWPQLVEMLYRRRSSVRDLITAFRNSMSNPFPNWKQSASNPAVRKLAIHAEY
jgi:hypothetical protein